MIFVSVSCCVFTVGLFADCLECFIGLFSQILGLNINSQFRYLCQCVFYVSQLRFDLGIIVLERLSRDYLDFYSVHFSHSFSDRFVSQSCLRLFSFFFFQYGMQNNCFPGQSRLFGFLLSSVFSDGLVFYSVGIYFSVWFDFLFYAAAQFESVGFLSVHFLVYDRKFQLWLYFCSVQFSQIFWTVEVYFSVSCWLGFDFLLYSAAQLFWDCWIFIYMLDFLKRLGILVNFLQQQLFVLR